MSRRPGRVLYTLREKFLRAPARWLGPAPENAFRYGRHAVRKDGNGGFDDLAISGTGRYVRVSGTVRATEYGCSLWEFGVYRS